ncbi:MAG: Outer membrane efflux protein BepC [Cryomorphaceae bacterium]|nr:MAG: Outer membrane efflux protein BepC [Cryomorphaceae bacterium]
MRGFYKKLFLVLLSGSLSSVAAQEVWTLDRCIEHAKSNNLEIQRGVNALALSELQELQSKLAFLPTANINGGYYWNFGLTIDPITNTRQPGSRQTLSTTAQGNWNLLSGGRNVYQLQQARLSTAASLYRLEEIKNNVFLNIASAYLQILVNAQLYDVAQGQLNTSTQSLERTKLLFDNGAISKDDYLQSVAQMRGDQGNLTSANNALVLSKLQLFQLLQLDTPFEEFEIAPPATLEALSLKGYGNEELKEAAVQKQPSVKAAAATQKSAEYAIKVAQAGRLPSLNFMAQLNSNYVQGLPYFSEYYTLTTYNLIENPTTGVVEQVPQQVTVPDPASMKDYTITNQLSDNWNQFLGFGVQIPIFNGGATHAAVQRAKIQENNAALDVKQSELQVRQTIERAYLDAQNSLALYQAALASSSAANEALDNAQLNFDQGVISAFDLGLSKNQFLAAKSREIQSKFDYLFKVKVLEFYLFNQITL